MTKRQEQPHCVFDTRAFACMYAGGHGLLNVDYATLDDIFISLDNSAVYIRPHNRVPQNIL